MGAPSTFQLLKGKATLVEASTENDSPLVLVKPNWNDPLGSRVIPVKGNGLTVPVPVPVRVRVEISCGLCDKRIQCRRLEVSESIDQSCREAGANFFHGGEDV